MLNNRLGTQPLDPSILLKLEGNTAQKTQPLNPATLPDLAQPQSLGDAFAKPKPANGSIPAQAGSISQALKPLDMDNLSAPMSAPQLGGSTGNSGMTEKEATLLLDVSGKMGDMRHANPVRFSQTVSALQNLNASANKDFSQLSVAHQDLLKDLGVTAENSQNILQKLYQIILPESGAASDSYKKAQNSVSSFLSGLNVQEQAVSLFENSKELKTVAGFLDGLSASGITSLIVDKVQQVNDFAVGAITSKSFTLATPMDFTVGKVLINAKTNPEQIEGIASILTKVKAESKLSREETSLLGQYGLFVGKGSELKSMDSSTPLSVESVNQLEAMIKSARTDEAGPMLDQVFEASREVLQASDHYQKMNERVRDYTAQLVADTAELESAKGLVSQGRQQTNILEAELNVATSEAKTLVDAKAVVQAINSAPEGEMPTPSAYGTFGTQSVSPTMGQPSAQPLSSEAQRILKDSGIELRQTNNGPELYVGERKISAAQAEAYLDKTIQEAQTNIANTQVELEQSKDKINANAADLAIKQQRVEAGKQKVIDAQADAAQAKADLTATTNKYHQIYAEAKPHLSAAEIQLIEETVNPSLLRTVTDAYFYGAETEVISSEALSYSNRVIEEARAELNALEKDRKSWEASLNQSQNVLRELTKALQESSQKEVKQTQRGGTEPAPQSEPIRRTRNNPLQPARTGTAPLNPIWLEKGAAQLQQQHKQRLEVQARNELSHFESIQSEKRFNADIQRSRRAITEKKAEQEQALEQTQMLQDKR